MHQELVRYATSSIEAGRLPYTSWFPYLGLGSAQYLHYQSLGAVLAGLAGTVIGPGNAYRWSLYLLVALWPLAVYLAARVFGFDRLASTAAALLSPFVVSFTGIAFERGAYSWTGGAEVWTQLLGSWALVFALACAWRGLGDGRYLAPAAALTGLTIALHFMCGYIALLGVAVFALAADGPLGRRLGRAALEFGGGVVAAAWVIVPLFLMRNWAAVDEPLAGTPYVKGYGARRELAWLFSGQLFDARRAWPVISVAVLAGALLALAKWRANPLTRAMLALFAACLVLSFGETTFGPLADVVPAHADLFFRRFQMGSQFAGVVLAGTGVAGAWDTWWWFMARFRPARGRRGPLLAASAFTVAMGAWFSPAVLEIARSDHADAQAIAAQRSADRTEGAMITPLVRYVERQGGGRAYAGLPSNWGRGFRVGLVPVFKYLETQDIDDMTYVVPSSSLMLSPEAAFDQYNPADYALFGVRYLFLPTGVGPPVPAREVMADGPYCLWEIPGDGYAEAVQVAGVITADRADVEARTEGLLDYLVAGEDAAMRWPGYPPVPNPPAQHAAPAVRAPAGAGTVKSVHADLAAGRLSAEAEMSSGGALLVSVAFDPGWYAYVDGHPARTEMLAPALIGVPLTPGRHHVVLIYRGFAWYPELWAAALAGLAGLIALGRRSA